MDREWFELKEWLLNSEDLSQTYIDKTFKAMIYLEINRVNRVKSEE